MTIAPLSWVSIARLGLVQSAIGAIVMLATSLLNRVMVVEYALPAALPAALVAWHYTVQLSRPVWGHGSDTGRGRTRWIVGGIAALGLGTVGAVGTLPFLVHHPVGAGAAIITAFALIGAGVSAAGTSLLALLATQVATDRRAAAAAITWIMMVAGIVITAAIAGSYIDPFSYPRLLGVTATVAGGAFAVSVAAVAGIEKRSAPVANSSPMATLHDALDQVFNDREAARFTLFVFIAMLAYSMQDMILEPFAGLLFAYTPGASTKLSGVQHGGVLAGMIVAGIGGSAFRARSVFTMRWWIVAGCLGSSFALMSLAVGARMDGVWPLAGNVALLGFCNGLFAVSAIGAMMALAGKGATGSEGVRMGVWGASQAIAFGSGGLVGAAGVDLVRHLTGDAPRAFSLVFGGEALLFLLAAILAVGVTRRSGESDFPLVAETIS